MIVPIIGIDQYMDDKADTICLGSFDGFHLGHQALAKHAAYMLTFDPHPKQVLNPHVLVERLTFPNEQKVFFPNQLIVPFTKHMATMSAMDFLNMIVKPLHPTKIAIGSDFRFGYNGQGDAKQLQRWGQQHDCSVVVLNIQHYNQQVPYKSSIIRSLLKHDPNMAFECLGHPYLIIGTVVPGKKRGRLLGFPTANIQVPPTKCVPAHGVYASRVVVDGRHYSSITNIGINPTFTDGVQTIETHILNQFSSTIYHQSIQLYLHHFIRHEQRFLSESALIQQMKADIIQVNHFHDQHPMVSS